MIGFDRAQQLLGRQRLPMLPFLARRRGIHPHRGALETQHLVIAPTGRTSIAVTVIEHDVANAVLINFLMAALAGGDTEIAVRLAGLNENIAELVLCLLYTSGQDYAQLNSLTERMPLVLPEPHNPEEWVRMALENNLSLRATAFDVDRARENVKLQKAGHYPTLDLQLSLIHI